jgi:hypothetical protein
MKQQVFLHGQGAWQDVVLGHVPAHVKHLLRGNGAAVDFDDATHAVQRFAPSLQVYAHTHWVKKGVT